MSRMLIAGFLALALTGCATGNELHGSWFLLIARDGTCRQAVHQADTEQLTTKTTWRGEKCAPAPAEQEEPQP